MRKVLIATSAGGHWVQMRRLLPAFEGCSLVFAGVAEWLDADLLPAPYYRLRNVSRSDPAGFLVIARQLARVVRIERPDVVVTTGAAPGLMALVMGKLLVRSRTVWIELDRQHRAAVAVRAAGPAGGGRMAGAVAASRPAGRSRALGRGAVIFVTVGGELPFDRLIRAMDAFAAAHPGEEVLAQIGASGFEPAHLHWVRLLERDDYAAAMARAELVVAHAGIGSVVTAGEYGKPIVLLPRRADLGEHRNDHQRDTAAHFVGRPGILVAENETELPARIAAARSAAGTPEALARTAPQEFLDRLRSFILG